MTASRTWFVIVFALLLTNNLAIAQVDGGGGGFGGGGTGGGFGGGGNTGGGFGGVGTGTPGNSVGQTTFGATGFGAAAGGAAGGGATSPFVNTGPFGQFLGNPFAVGFPLGTQTNVSFIRPYPTTLSFGTVLYDGTQTGTGVGAAGRTTGLGTGVGGTGVGTITISTPTTVTGASSAGIRRAPPYLTEPAFELPPRRTGELLRPDLQALIDRSSRLPSRASIQVMTVGEVIVLRGWVGNDRERTLAEAVIRMTPGVDAVNNELMIRPTTAVP